MMLGGFQSWLTIWILILLICAAATTTILSHDTQQYRHQDPKKCYLWHFCESAIQSMIGRYHFCPPHEIPLVRRWHFVHWQKGPSPTGSAYRIMPGWCDFKNLMIGEKFLFLPQILFCQAQDLDHGKKKQSWTHEDKGKTIAYEPP